MFMFSIIIINVYIYIKDFPKERYNTYAKSCNSNFQINIYMMKTKCSLLIYNKQI